MKEPMLTEYELKTLTPMIVETLQHKIGKNNSLKGKHIAAWLCNCGHNVKEGTVRKIINYIRSNDLVIGLVATGGGYYRTDNPDELQKWIDKEIGIIKQKAGPLKRMKLYRSYLLNNPNFLSIVK